MLIYTTSKVKHHPIIVWAATSENRSLGFPTRSYTYRAVQPQKMARGLKFRIQKAEELYYLSSENKNADQLRGYREADLRLCFRICKNLVFSRRGSFQRCFSHNIYYKRTINLCYFDTQVFPWSVYSIRMPPDTFTNFLRRLVYTNPYFGVYP